MCCQWNFTDFCFWLDRIARNNRLLDIPYGTCWRIYATAAYVRIILGFTLIVLSISCIFTGLQNSFLYDKINCLNGSSLAAPMCNMVVVFLLIVALKQQQSGWSCFVAFVFTTVVALLNIFFLVDMLNMTFHWVFTKSRPIDEDWPAAFAWIDGLIVLIFLLLESTDLILITFYLLLVTDFCSWKSRNSTNITGHSRFH